MISSSMRGLGAGMAHSSRQRAGAAEWAAASAHLRELALPIMQGAAAGRCWVWWRPRMEAACTIMQTLPHRAPTHPMQYIAVSPNNTACVPCC